MKVAVIYNKRNTICLQKLLAGHKGRFTGTSTVIYVGYKLSVQLAMRTYSVKDSFILSL
jgi:hypothetical protein